MAEPVFPEVIAPSPAAALPAGACFGFRVFSTLSFRYLRDGDGEPLWVEAPSDEEPSPGRLVAEWVPRPDRPFHARLHQDGWRYQLWIEDGGWYVVDPGARRITLPRTDDIVRREERLWGIPTVLCFLQRGDLPLHAAAVEVEGAAVLLAAPGRFGKTTLAAALFREGYRVLSEDLSCLRLRPFPQVIPGPAMLRVRRDVADRLKLCGLQAVAESDNRISFTIDKPRRGDCRPVRLRAIVFLKPAHDGIATERVRATDAIPDLWTLSFHMPTDEDRRRCFGGIADLAGSVPVWALHRPLRIEDLPVTVEHILAICRGHG